MLIPPVFHQIWLGLEPLPGEHARYQETWLAHHPGWDLRFWTEENLPRDLRRAEALERIRPPTERSDFLRLELLWRFGGVYVDTDMECLRPIDPLIGEATLFSACSGRARAHHALFGSVAGHPFLDAAIDSLLPSEFYGSKPATLAPFSQILEDHRDEVVLLEPPIHRAPDTDRRVAFAVHHRDGIWRADPVFVRRLREVKDAARLWRARCEELEAELDELRGRSRRAQQ